MIAQFRDVDTHLHPNHWLIQMAASILIDKAEKEIFIHQGKVTVDDMITNCRFMLKILNELHPGLCAEKGMCVS